MPVLTTLYLSSYHDPVRGVSLPHFADGDPEAQEGKQCARAEAASVLRRCRDVGGRGPAEQVCGGACSCVRASFAP